jgi:hypothetical protein
MLESLFQRSEGFRPNEVRKIQRLIEKYKEQLLESWHEIFGD